MAFDGYIQIAEIPGEALDEKYSKWIEIIGYNFGVNQSTSATASSSGGASSGRTTLTNFTFTKYLDSASCKLMEASCAGQHLKEVKLVLCRAGRQAQTKSSTTKLCWKRSSSLITPKARAPGCPLKSCSSTTAV